ncbi:MAG: peptidoglycan DD-metalloendopeptidase family protein [Comamonas sp.]|nr:peptidoglycan DD-metalloendopeptidase family protein [Comamonas sp.]
MLSQKKIVRQVQRWALPGVLVALLAACAQTNQAPVESRGGFGQSSSGVDPASLPGAENAGKPGYYTVRPGDTLIRIGLEHGRNWKDIARWNNLHNPDIIEVGQVVRVTPPQEEGGYSGSAGVGTGAVQATTLPPADASGAASEHQAVKVDNSTGLAFTWPANGSLITRFNEGTNKGISIAGKAGDPVMAAADGKVMLITSELRGYGHLVIVSHSDIYLTAYAHNQKILVKEDQVVKKGQKIAEMGNSDADRVKLHFEVRRQGVPMDPLRYLPAR